jgi:phosphoketolase
MAITDSPFFYSIDPAESGAVIPIVHVNGFKISERTIYGCMDDKEMVSLFTGYGYQCRFVEDLEDIVSGFKSIRSSLLIWTGS